MAMDRKNRHWQKRGRKENSTDDNNSVLVGATLSKWRETPGSGRDDFESSEWMDVA